MMSKVVYNACYGGFGLSDKAIKRYAELKGLTLYPESSKYGLTTYWIVPENERPTDNGNFYSLTTEERIAFNKAYKAAQLYDRYIKRTDPALVQVVEELGDEANGQCACLRIAEIPSGTAYRIDEYDGNESVETKDSYDWDTAP